MKSFLLLFSLTSVLNTYVSLKIHMYFCNRHFLHLVFYLEGSEYLGIEFHLKS